MASALLVMASAVVTLISPTAVGAAPPAACAPLPQVADWPSGGAPVISADGRFAAYVSRENVNGGNPDGSDELWAMNLDTGTRRQMTNRPGRVAKPIVDIAIDGDGTTFAYLAGIHHPNREAHLVERSPRSDRTLGAAPGQEIALSANAKRVAYGTGEGMVIRNNVTGGRTTLAGADSNPGGFDATGSRLAFRSRGDLVGENDDGSPEVFLRRFGASASTTQITDTTAPNYPLSPVLSGDGTALLFFAMDLVDPAVALFRYGVSSGATDLVTSGGTSDMEPNYPPAINHDGSIIMFTSRGAVGGLEVLGGDVIRFRADTGEFTNLTGNPVERLSISPSLDATGTRVVYLSYELSETGEFRNVEFRAVSCPLPAPRPTISGTVTDASSGEPIRSAWVMAVSAAGALTAGAVTSGTGRYSLTVPDGTYRVQTIDPSGRHRGEWYDDQDLGGFDAAQPVTPSIAGPTTIDVALDRAGRSASFTGTVTDAVTDEPIVGAWVAATDPAGQVVRGAATRGDGTYTIGDLARGEYGVIFIDRSGAHELEYHQDADSPATAASIELAPGESATVDATLQPTAAPSSETTINGEVNDMDSGLWRSLAWILAFDTDGRFVRGAESRLFGSTYSLGLPAGSYKLQIIDSQGLHAGEWFDGHDLGGFDDADVVTTTVEAPTTVDFDPSPAGPSGVIEGTILEDGTQEPLQGMWVAVIDAATGEVVSGGSSGADGSYTARSLPAGSYKVAFVDPTGAHEFEFHQDVTVFSAASSVEVDAGLVTTVDADLTPRS